MLIVLDAMTAYLPTPVRSARNLLNVIPRIWLTKAATGTRGVSSAPNAAVLWWRSHSLPRMSSCSVLNVTPMSIHQSVSTARRPSCLVPVKWNLRAVPGMNPVLFVSIASNHWEQNH